jgi:hypothetical protein
LKLPKIRGHLEKKYTKAEPFPTMFILNNYDGFETTKKMCDELITDMYVVKGLTYITLEKEDPSLDNPNILRVFSYTRGLDLPSPELIDDLIEAKYGKRVRFFGKKDSLNTILAWQSPGIWRTGVQFLQYELEHDMVDDVVIEAAIGFSENFAALVSSITIQDLWLLKSDLKKVTIAEAVKAFENLQAQHFEMCVQEFLRSKHGYTDVITRYKPPYLKGKEIDVYARKGRTGERKTVTVCECKLRFYKREIRLKEIADFLKVASKVKQYESELIAREGGSIKLEAWLITNTTVSPRALEILHQNDIKVMIAKLPSKWRKRGDWKIIEMKKYLDELARA